MRNVQYIFPAETIQLGNSEVLQALPVKHIQQVSPFLLLHHFKQNNLKPGEIDFDVAPHPHRGFEPVTFLFEGGIHHRDSRGNEGILKSGDVQWMTAGMGIIHSESASKEFLESGGNLHGVQLWVNLPKKYKMEQPQYQDIKAENIPAYESEDGKIKIRIVAGKWNQFTGPAKIHSSLFALHALIKKDKREEIDIPENFNSVLYVLSGLVEINDMHYAKEGMIAIFKNDEKFISVSAKEDAEFLLLAGEPIDEPVASYGPFVMNTQTELLEAIRDYQMGKMGMLTY